jgi:hypothetical protein
MQANRFLGLTFVLASLALASCSDRIPLQGRVTFSDDGSPLSRGMVLFDDGQIMARGPIQSDGTYAVGLDRDNDGIPAGTYRVSIVDAAEEIPPESEYVAPSYRKLIDEKYFLSETSGLEITVDSSTRRFDIEVDRSP